jgi:hypothetical protein
MTTMRRNEERLLPIGARVRAMRSLHALHASCARNP